LSQTKIREAVGIAIGIKAEGERKFLGMQDFDFAQIQPNLPKSDQFCPNFVLILFKFRPKLTKFV